jgi:hypothetical protein
LDRNHHVDLTLLHAMCHGYVSTVDQYVPVVAEMEKRIVKHSRKPPGDADPWNTASHPQRW